MAHAELIDKADGKIWDYLVHETLPPIELVVMLPPDGQPHRYSITGVVNGVVGYEEQGRHDWGVGQARFTMPETQPSQS